MQPQLKNKHNPIHRQRDPESINTLTYSSLKIAAVGCLSLAISVGVLSVGGTISSFFNQEGSGTNAFQAGTWDSVAPQVAFSSAVLLSDSLIDPSPGDDPPADPSGGDATTTGDTPPAESATSTPPVTLSDVVVVDPPSDTPPADPPPPLELGDTQIVPPADPPVDSTPDTSSDPATDTPAQ